MIIAAWGGDKVSQTGQMKLSYLDFSQEQKLCDDNLKSASDILAKKKKNKKQNNAAL